MENEKIILKVWYHNFERCSGRTELHLNLIKFNLGKLSFVTQHVHNNESDT